MQKALGSLVIIFTCLLIGVGIPQVRVWMIDKEIEKIQLSNQDLKDTIGELQKEYEYLTDANRLYSEAIERETLQMVSLSQDQQVEVHYHEIQK